MNFKGFTHLRYNKTLIGKQFLSTSDLLYKEDLNVELSFASSSIEIIVLQ